MHEANGDHTSREGQTADQRQPSEQQQDEGESLAAGKLRSADLTVSFLKVRAEKSYKASDVSSFTCSSLRIWHPTSGSEQDEVWA